MAMNSESDWIEIKSEGFIELVGPVYHRQVENGRGSFRFEVAPKHRNRSKFLHGGMLMTLADQGLAWTARQNDQKRLQATIQLDMHFIRPANVGDTIALECQVIRETRSLVFVEGVISVGNEIVATARGVWKLIASDRS